jgi:hypothetical protein
MITHISLTFKNNISENDILRNHILNPRDADNLKFLIESSTDTIKRWYAQADADDIIYAQELLRRYENSLGELQDESVFYSDLSDANDVINNIKGNLK